MRLAAKTFLMLVAIVLLAVVALGALFAFNLERGFVAYLNGRHQEQLEVLGGLVAAEIERSGSIAVFRRNPLLWRQMLRRSAAATLADGGEVPGTTDGAAGTAPAPSVPAGPPGAGAPPRPWPPGVAGPRAAWPPGSLPGPAPGDPLRPPPTDADPFTLGARVALLDAQRVPVLPPRRLPANVGEPIERAVVVAGRTVGFLRLWPLVHVDRPEDRAFLRAQYVRIAWAAAGLTLLMAVVAPLLARRVTHPLATVTAATARIARGQFNVRLASSRRDEVGELIRNVDAMAQGLDRLERARRQWIAEIAHELRTPLTVLRAELEALADGVRPLVPAAVGSLQEEVGRLARLADDLHQLALADLNALPCSFARLDVVALVERICARYGPLAQAKGLTLDAELPGRAVELDGDAQRLEQLLVNLLDNSVRYTDAPGRIRVRVAPERARIVLTVEDTAPGVPAADCARLFEPLYRADPARSRATGGSGLGLAIARAIVAAHGGTIVAAPAADGGLAVTVALPLQRRNAPVPPGTPAGTGS